MGYEEVQSSALEVEFWDFQYISVLTFSNHIPSKATGGRKLRPNFAHFAPPPVKFSDGWA